MFKFSPAPQAQCHGVSPFKTASTQHLLHGASVAHAGSASRQKGGTLLGFVLGVLVGLGGALAVAVYVTKVPVPFVDRGISRKPDQDAVEAERNKSWNPNGALGGQAGRPAGSPEPAAADTGKPQTPVVTPAPAAPAQATLSASPAAAEPAAPKATSTDPLGDLAKAKAQPKVVATAPASASAPGTVATAPAASAEPFAYFVQVGAYRTPEDAQAQRAKLTLMGLDAKVSERDQAGRTIYRVRLGPFDRQSDAEGTQASLQTNGVETALVRVQR